MEMNDTVVVTMDSGRLKRVRNSVPAHWRYWQFVGFARHWDRDVAEVQVYGGQIPGFETPVLMRRRSHA